MVIAFDSPSVISPAESRERVAARRSARVALQYLCLLALCGTLTACGNGAQDRQQISGTVTFDGAPLDQGAITFVSQSAPGAVYQTAIENGAYEIPKAQGMLPGTYRVTISATERVPVETDPNKAMARASTPAHERVPAKYNTKTELSADVQPGGTGKFDFELKSK